jgi:hypothetical protein
MPWIADAMVIIIACLASVDMLALHSYTRR